MEIYLDNSATTRPSAEVREMAAEWMKSGWFNPSALYRPAMETQKQVDAVRELCRQAVKATDAEVLFTAGGTEADNLALLGRMRGVRGRKRVLISAVEHPAVSACCEELRRMGHEPEEIPVTREGRIDLDRLEGMLDEDVALIAVMQVNNEVGAVQPLEQISGLRNRLCPDAALHVDGVQGFLRSPALFQKWELQSYALSAHKIHGLKGCGALIAAKGHGLKPIVFGGGQENGLRSGTENTLGILALGEAIRTWDPDSVLRMRRLKLLLRDELQKRIPEAEVNGPDPAGEESAPHILNMALRPVRSQTMLFALEGDGIYVSAGSACASRKQRISPVLKAMGLPPERADCSLRFSLSPETTEEEVIRAAERAGFHWQALKKYTRR